MKITKKAFEELRKHCKETPKLESCGYIFGDDNSINSIVRGKNLDKSPVTYTIDPESTLKSVFRKDFKGVYHSHIGVPVPSSIDERKKKYPNMHYLIYSISQDVLKAYFWNNGMFTEVKVEVI